MRSLVAGVGVYSKGKYLSKINYKRTKEYQTWKCMLERCYSEVTQLRQPTYVGCTVVESFKDFQYFAEWCNKQIGFGNEGWHLDKDLLVFGNKQYSEDTCVFVPKDVNLLFPQRSEQDGMYPVGVSYCERGKHFLAKCEDNGGILRKYTKSLNEAIIFYGEFKSSTVRKRAETYRSQLDPRLYAVLSEYNPTLSGLG